MRRYKHFLQNGFTTTSSLRFSSHSRGFTLVELIIVMVIISFLSAMALAISRKYGQSKAVSTVNQDIRSMLYNARSQAQSVASSQCNGAQFTGIRVEFCNSTDKTLHDCSITNTSNCVSNGRPDYQMNLICNNSYAATLQKVSIPANITISPDNCSVLFQPFGASVIGSGNIVINGSSKTTTIVVQNNGVIQ